MELSPKAVADARSALGILQDKTTLVAAASYWVKTEGRVKKQVTLAKVIDEYVAEIKERSKSQSYPEAQRRACEQMLKDFPTVNISEVTAEMLESIRAKRKWEPLNWRNHLRDWKMLFKFAAHPRRRYIAENPVELIPIPPVEVGVEIYTMAAAKRLCETALALDNETLAFVAVGLFSGIRVEEMVRLTWDLFDWDESVIRLGPNQVKSSGANRSSIPRRVPITPQLGEWLALVKRRTGPFLKKNFRRRYDETKRVASLPWPGKKKSPFGFLRNALRHSFASHHCVHFDDSAKTRELLGQKSPGVFWKHYYHYVTKAEAAEYMSLLPPAPARLRQIQLHVATTVKTMPARDRKSRNRKHQPLSPP